MRRKFHSYIFGLSALMLVGFANLTASSILFSLHHTENLPCAEIDDAGTNLVNYDLIETFLNALNTDHSKGFLVTILEIPEFEEDIAANHNVYPKSNHYLYLFQSHVLRFLLVDYQKGSQLRPTESFASTNKIYLKYQVLLI